jgi:cysteine-S-conjugate beta-lyase
VLGAAAHRSPQATYLAWLDLAARFPGPRPARRLEKEAKVKLSEGAEFAAGTGVDTSSFVRLNFATNPDNLQTILARLTGRLAGSGQAAHPGVHGRLRTP